MSVQKQDEHCEWCEKQEKLLIKWKQNGWMTSAGAPVKNKDLWIAIDETRKKLNVVEWRWVKAHNGDPRNEEADKLARESAKNISV